MTVINSGNVIDQMQNLLDWGNASDYSSIKFSPQENFQLKAEWYSNLWQTDLSKVYWDLANNLWQYSWYANETVSAYNNLLKTIKQQCLIKEDKFYLEQCIIITRY